MPEPAVPRPAPRVALAAAGGLLAVAVAAGASPLAAQGGSAPGAPPASERGTAVPPSRATPGGPSAARAAEPGVVSLPHDPHPGSRPAAAADPELLERALRRAEGLSPLTSLLVSVGGDLVVEEYYRGMRSSRPVNVKSVSKTLLSPLVGIAIRDGLLEDVDQPIRELLPGYFEDEGDPAKGEITLRDLLTMRAGLQSTSFGNYGAWVSSRDWVADAIRRPLECDPGECWEYSTGNTHLLSAILARAAGTSLLAWAREVLFDPLGIRVAAWDRDPLGRHLGGNNMALTPRDLLRFGELYLNGGRWEGRQLVPLGWILASWQPRARSPWNGHGYGYLWWIEEWGGERAYFGWGYGGQYVVVVPSLRLVAVTTSSLADRRRRHIRDMRRFFDDYLVPAFARAPRPDGPPREDEGTPGGAPPPASGYAPARR